MRPKFSRLDILIRLRPCNLIIHIVHFTTRTHVHVFASSSATTTKFLTECITVFNVLTVDLNIS